MKEKNTKLSAWSHISSWRPISPSSLKNCEERLSNPIRGCSVFSPKEILKNKKISLNVWKNLHLAISWLMQSVYQNHLQQKELQGILNMPRELIYIDASKKKDLNIFDYMTKTYFNATPEAVRKKYNDFYLKELKDFHKTEFSSLTSEEVGDLDILFYKENEIQKNTPYWREKWPDCTIGFAPMASMEILMLLAHQRDLNVFLDNISFVTEKEMDHINAMIRSGLLMGWEKWLWLYINNAYGTWDFNLGHSSQPPQDGHDMKIEYM